MCSGAPLDLRDEDHDRDLAETRAHDVKGLVDPIELHGHCLLASVEIAEVSSSSKVYFWDCDAHEY